MSLRIHLLVPAALAVAFLPGSVRADLSETGPWTTASPSGGVSAMVPWNGRLVAATPRGGLLLVDPQSLEMESLQTGDGLTSDAVNDLTVDPQGNLWLATGREGLGAVGLCRLDPSFRVRPVVQDLASAEISAVAAAGDFLYYGTPGQGAGRLSAGLPEAVYNQAEDGLADDRVLAVAARGGDAWFLTAAGISLLRNNLMRDADTGLDRVPARDLVGDAQGVFAAGRVGVHRWNGDEDRWEPWGSGLADSLQALALGEDEIFALGARGGAWRASRQTGQWLPVVLDADLRDFTTVGVDPRGRPWFGGALVDTLRVQQGRRSLLQQPDLGVERIAAGLVGPDVRDMVSDGEGGLWLSFQAPFNGLTHWRRDGSFVSYDFIETTAGFGWCSDRAKFALERTRSGDIWVGHFRDCVTRMRPHPSDDPSRAEYFHFTAAETGLRLARLTDIVEDPDGRLWFLSLDDGEEEGLGLDILLDPSRPLDPDAWLALTTDNSLLPEGQVVSLTFQEPDVAWIAVDGEGVLRWDYDGPIDLGSGNIHPSALDDPDAWDRIPYAGAPTSISFTQPRQTLVGPNGLLYVATADKGLFEIDYDPAQSIDSQRIRVRRIIQEGAAGTSLPSRACLGATFDATGRLWVVTDAGLNRLDVLGDALRVQTWTTVEAFQLFQLQLAGYTGSVLAPMAGLPTSDDIVPPLLYDAAFDEISVGCRTGVSRARAGLGIATPEIGVDFIVYPNPYPGPGGADLGVFLAGLEGEGEALVEVYDLQGSRIVSGTFSVEDLERRPIWDVKDVDFENVASGLYLIRVERAGQVGTAVLAVER